MKTPSPFPHQLSEFLARTLQAPEALPSLGEFGERVVNLCDGRPGLRTTLQVEIREPQARPASSPPSPAPPASPPNCLDFIASSDALDRFEEIILPQGWHLENYRRNPVFQNAHQYGDIVFTLGKALITEVRQARPRSSASDSIALGTADGPSTLNSLPSTGFSAAAAGALSTRNHPPSTFLYQRIQFAIDANPMARIAYALYRDKFLNAVSVGFIPLRWEDGPPSSSSSSAQPSTLHHPPSTTCRRRYLEQELLEVSAVAIPANPDALQLGLRAGTLETTDLRDLLDFAGQVAAQIRSPAFTPHVSRSTVHHPASRIQQPTASICSPASARQHPASDFCSHPAAPNTLTGAFGVGDDEAQWLQLARALRQILRRS